MASAWIGSDMGAAWMHWRKKNKRAWRWCLCCRSFSLSLQNANAIQWAGIYTSGSTNTRLYDRPREDCQMYWTESLSLSQLKKHTLSFYGDYNVASCLPTRSTFGEYITFQGEKSRKKKRRCRLFFEFWPREKISVRRFLAYSRCSEVWHSLVPNKWIYLV